MQNKLLDLVGASNIDSWNHALEMGGYIEFIGATGVLGCYMENGYVILVAWDKTGKFKHSLISRMKMIGRAHNKVVVASSVATIEKHLATFGFRFDVANKLYIRG